MASMRPQLNFAASACAEENTIRERSFHAAQPVNAYNPDTGHVEWEVNCPPDCFLLPEKKPFSCTVTIEKQLKGDTAAPIVPLSVMDSLIGDNLIEGSQFVRDLRVVLDGVELNAASDLHSVQNVIYTRLAKLFTTKEEKKRLFDVNNYVVKVSNWDEFAMMEQSALRDTEAAPPAARAVQEPLAQETPVQEEPTAGSSGMQDDDPSVGNRFKRSTKKKPAARTPGGTPGGTPSDFAVELANTQRRLQRATLDPFVLARNKQTIFFAVEGAPLVSFPHNYAAAKIAGKRNEVRPLPPSSHIRLNMFLDHGNLLRFYMPKAFDLQALTNSANRTSENLYHYFIKLENFRFHYQLLKFKKGIRNAYKTKVKKGRLEYPHDSQRFFLTNVEDGKYHCLKRFRLPKDTRMAWVVMQKQWQLFSDKLEGRTQSPLTILPDTVSAIRVKYQNRPVWTLDNLDIKSRHRSYTLWNYYNTLKGWGLLDDNFSDLYIDPVPGSFAIAVPVSLLRSGKRKRDDEDLGSCGEEVIEVEVDYIGDDKVSQDDMINLVTSSSGMIIKDNKSGWKRVASKC